jgi:DNA-binding CsgD family transcriptional regulator
VLKRRASALVDNVQPSKLEAFSIQQGSKRLTVRSLSSLQAAEHRLVLSETGEELDANSLQTLGLTKREAEVLFWVSQGKRNSEIAEILGARSRTIGKHVERILGKLCVETRTRCSQHRGRSSAFALVRKPRTSADVQTPARTSYSLADDEYNFFIYPRFCCFSAII